MVNQFHKQILTLVVAMSLVYPIAAQSSQDILGKWKPMEHPEKQVEIYLGKDALYYGKANNPNGKELLKKLQYSEATHTFKGIMVAPDKDMEVNVTINIVHDDTLKIVAKKLSFTKIIQFVRIK
jgi:uncharacterized protein (DUF2147 family)